MFAADNCKILTVCLLYLCAISLSLYGPVECCIGEIFDGTSSRFNVTMQNVFLKTLLRWCVY